ncbi:MAG: L,D-transpeptidase [Anaerolineales bacterium]
MSDINVTYQQAIELANQAFRDGDHSSARKWASRAAKLDSQKVTPWLMLAALATPAAALEYYRQALRIDPDNRLARVGIKRIESKIDHQDQGALTGSFTQAAVDARTVQKKPSSLTWLAGVTLVSILILAMAGGISSLRSMAVSAHLLPTEGEPPVNLAVRVNPLTPTPTPTFTPTPTPTNTPTPTPTFTPTPPYTPTPVATSTAVVFPPGNLTDRPPQISADEFWIEVNLSDQQLLAHKGNKLLKKFSVSTGTWATPTVTGQYQVYVKLVSTYMGGPGYSLPNVPYTMYFFGGYGIHGTYWHNNFGTPMSHGCVNMLTSEAEWVFNRSVVGTWVIIHY